MSANYYWSRGPVGPEAAIAYSDSPAIHVGKRTAAGGGWTRFSFACAPETVLTFLLGRPDEIVAADEYGELYTGSEMLALIDRCNEQDVASVGVVFC